MVISKVEWFVQCRNTAGNVFDIIEMNWKIVIPSKLIIRKTVKDTIELQIFRSHN